MGITVKLLTRSMTYSLTVMCSARTTSCPSRRLCTPWSYVSVSKLSVFSDSLFWVFRFVHLFCSHLLWPLKYVVCCQLRFHVHYRGPKNRETVCRHTISFQPPSHQQLSFHVGLVPHVLHLLRHHTAQYGCLSPTCLPCSFHCLFLLYVQFCPAFFLGRLVGVEYSSRKSAFSEPAAVGKMPENSRRQNQSRHQRVLGRWATTCARTTSRRC